jgi:hypothetical protein
MAHSQRLSVQAQLACQAALDCPCPDWRGVAELFRAALAADLKRAPKSPKPHEIADYSVDHLRLKYRSPRVAVRFVDGEAVFPSAAGKPLNIGRALRVAIAMYRSRRTVQQRLGFREYDRAMPVPEIFQVRCLETDELFDPRACNAHTARERASCDPERALAMLRTREVACQNSGDTPQNRSAGDREHAHAREGQDGVLVLRRRRGAR